MTQAGVRGSNRGQGSSRRGKQVRVMNSYLPSGGRSTTLYSRDSACGQQEISHASGNDGTSDKVENLENGSSGTKCVEDGGRR